MRERCTRRALVAAGLGGAGATLAGCTGPGDPIYRVNAKTATEPESGTPVVDWTDDCLDGAPAVITVVRRAVADGDASKVLEEAEYEQVNETIEDCPHPPDGEALGKLGGMYVRVESTTVKVWTLESRPG